MLNRTLAVCLFTLLFLEMPASGQAKRPLQHDDVNQWIRLSASRLSSNGQWVAWVEGPEKGDGVLKVSSSDGKTRFAVPRGTSPVISWDNRYVFFSIVPQADSVRQQKLRKAKPKDMSSDTLGILDLMSGQIEKMAHLDSFKAPEEGSGWMAYLLTTEASKLPNAPKDTTATEKADEKKDEKKKEKKEGKTLVLRSLPGGSETQFRDVTSFLFAKTGGHLGFLRENKDGSADGAFVVAKGDSAEATLLKKVGNYGGLTFSKDGSKAAFLTNADDFEAEQPSYSLYASTLGAKIDAGLLATGSTAGIPQDWWVSENGTLSFSDSGSRLFFGTAPKPAPEKKDDDILEDEKVKVDIWNWKDPLLQPMQLVQASREKKRTYEAVYHYDSGKVVQLATEVVPNVTVSNKGDGLVALGTSSLNYQLEVSWESPGFTDAWIINPVTGAQKQVLTAVQDSPRLSPGGKYVTYWDRDERLWMVIDSKSLATTSLSSGAKFPIFEETHDSPSEPDSYGSAGWTEGDAEFVFYDGFDVLAVTPTGRLREVTKGYGRTGNVRLRVEIVERDEPWLSAKNDWMISGQNLNTMEAGYFSLNPTVGTVSQLAFGPYSYSISSKAKNANVLLTTRSNFREFPDLQSTNMRFENPIRLSNANPQQAAFSWGTSELVEWTSIDGDVLKGILYKPDGFDASKKYPMMVYFYEKNSTSLHRYVAPSAGSSSINYSFYVSRGYLLFVPDIPYKIGYPGESAMNAIMPGITQLIDKGFVDRDRVGVQGHSWGGYQIAYMVTQTNLFAAAEAGAPVVNMTSAYGGIRWGSGMSRAFQYERTQSRIGGTLWNAQQRYIHNSPLFQADKVQTPLLMLHNDNDGAVPWYQGIEYFSALRRLNKPVWMLNYNGADHGLADLVDRRDWAIRMQQFFDHYLMDAPAPIWLQKGVPAVNKGQTLGLDLTDN